MRCYMRPYMWLYQIRGNFNIFGDMQIFAITLFRLTIWPNEVIVNKLLVEYSEFSETLQVNDTFQGAICL